MLAAAGEYELEELTMLTNMVYNHGYPPRGTEYIYINNLVKDQWNSRPAAKCLKNTAQLA